MRAIKLIMILVLASVPGWIFAQQRAQFTQYMNNNYVLNPAVGGTEEYTDIKASFRKQWINFSGSPETYYVTVHSPIAKFRGKPHPIRDKQKSFHSLGGVIYDDVTGATHRSAAQISYCFNMALMPRLRVSVGALIGVQQFKLDGHKLDFPDNNNEVVGVQRTLKPDGSLGLWFYNSSFFAGAALSQIFNNNLDVTLLPALSENDPQRAEVSKLNHHYFVTGGFKVPLSHLVTLIPSVMLKYAYPTPVSIDINAKMRYLDLFWLGMSYRNLESFSALAGITINNFIDIGYSYDGIVNGIGPHTMPGGSHEILVGIRLKPPGRLLCPSNFW